MVNDNHTNTCGLLVTSVLRTSMTFQSGTNIALCPIRRLDNLTLLVLDKLFVHIRKVLA